MLQVRPICSNCKRHGAICEYIINRPRPSAWILPSIVTKADDVASSSPNINEETLLEPDQRRFLELHLLHHFKSVVCDSFPAAEHHPSIESWTNHLIATAFEHNFLLNSIFSIAALHLDFLERNPDHEIQQSLHKASDLERFHFAGRIPSCPVTPSRAHGIYFNIAAKQQREALANISPKNANALWMTTIMLSVQALARARDDSRLAEYTTPLHWLRMMGGIAEMEATIRPFARPATLLDFMIDDKTETDIEIEGKPINVIYPSVFYDLVDWEKVPETDLTNSSKETYEKANRYLRHLYENIQTNSFAHIYHEMLRPGSITSPGFLSLIERQSPRALVILACYCAMTMAVDDHWVFHGMACREVSGLNSFIPEEWTWAMEWPVKILECEKTQFGEHNWRRRICL